MKKAFSVVIILMLALVAGWAQGDSTFVFHGQKGKVSLRSPVGILKKGEKVSLAIETPENLDTNKLKVVVVGAAGLHFGQKVHITFSEKPVALVGIIQTTIDPQTQRPKHKLLDIVGLPTTDRDQPFIALYADGLPFDWREGVSRRARSVEMKMMYNTLPGNCTDVAVTKLEWATAEKGTVIDTEEVAGANFMTGDALTSNSESKKLLIRATEITCTGLGPINPQFKKSFSMNIHWSSPNESLLEELNMLN